MDLKVFSPGGGFAIGYVRSEPPPRIAEYADAITKYTSRLCNELGFGTPQLG